MFSCRRSLGRPRSGTAITRTRGGGFVGFADDGSMTAYARTRTITVAAAAVILGFVMIGGSSAAKPLRQAPRNTAAPVISGDALVGATLSSSPGSWSGTVTTYAYQWHDCDLSGGSCTPIAGATGSVHAPAPGQKDTTLRVAVTASNRYGLTTALSDATPPVAAAPATAPVNVSPPSVSGAAVVGGALSAGMGVWSGEPSGYAWEWRRCDSAGAGCVAVAGAGSSYLLGSVDLGATLRVAVTALNGVGSTTALSAPSAVVQPQPQPQPAPGACTKTSVATSGLQTFLNSLASGDIACLGAGSYSGNVSISTPNVTLRSAPGVRAQIRGYVWIRNTANGVKLADLDLDGTYSSTSYAVMVHGDDVTLSNMDIKNLKSGYASAICVTAGYGFETTPANIAYNLTVKTSRIHDCGNDSHEHALYLESTRNARIVDNYLYDNGGEGLQLYPDAQGSVIEYNVIDGNSLDYKANIMFAGEAAGGEYRYDHASSNNTVRYNTITNAATRYNIDSYYPGAKALPTGNLVTSNCVWNAPYGNFGYDRGTGDYSQTNNKNSNPTYQDPANKDFRLQTGSPCTGWAPRTTPAT